MNICSDNLMEPNHVRVEAGTQFRDEQNIIPYKTILEEIIIHPNFSRSSLEGNLAIGILSDSLPTNDVKLGFIDIEDLAFYPPVKGTKCKIYGWSLTTRGEESPHLLSGDVEIEDVNECDTTMNKITTTTICAGPYQVNGCETDDGGPLICNGKVFGLIDYRHDGFCSRIYTNRLGTYVDISQYHDWIVDHSSDVGRISGISFGIFSFYVISIVMSIS